MDEAGPRPRVDFYVLKDPAEQAAGRFLCRLVEKAWKSGHRVYVHTAGAEATRRLDALLWSYRQDAFLPHEPYDPAAPEPTAPVLIGHRPEGPAGGGEVLVNAAPELPGFYRGFARVAEVVPAVPAERAAGRERYRRYREADVHLHSHDV